MGLAIDTSGNLFVADIGSHIIRRITPAAVVTTFAGTAGLPGTTDAIGAAARFSQPSGITVDAGGNLYVVSPTSHTVRKITSAGVVTTLAGSGAAGAVNGLGNAAQFNQPRSAAVDSAGNVYIADNGNQTVRKVSPDGSVSTLAGVTGTLVADGLGLAAGFRGPAGIAVTSDGTVYVTDTSQTIRKVTPGGLVATLAGLADTPGRVDATGSAARFVNPLGLTVNAAGTVYLVSGSFVRAVTATGAASTLAGSPAQGTADGTGGNAQFSTPRGVTLDRDGNLFITDTNNHTIRRVTAGGVTSTFAGSPGQAGSTDGAGAAARFNLPRGIAIDVAGNLYVADGGGHTIRKITPAGIVSTLAGSAGQSGSADGTGATARFDQPRGVAIDSGGNVFVIDYNNHTIRRVTPTGVVTTVAGAPGVVGNVDATGAAARFNFPNDIAVDAAGALYIADTGNYLIRKGVPAAPPRVESEGAISNLSVRATLASGQTLIMGFTMQGGAKNVLLRAVGPGLTQFGVGGAMVDPRLTLFQNTTSLQASDNWGGSETLGTAFASVGAFGLPPASLDAALLRSVEGGHTAQVTGTGAGTVLVEAYDAGAGFSPRLTNVSARNRSGAGGDVLIAGFTIAGTDSRNLLIRAIGPTLAGFGVTGTLADPKLEIYSGPNKIAENDTWAPALTATFQSVGAFALTAGSRDAALVIALPPGGYTVQVSGADGGTGEALVELYELP